MKQVALRIVPFLMACYFVSFVDRVNLGFAALEMVKDLHLSPTVFGFGGGIHVANGSLTVKESTITNNRVVCGAGSGPFYLFAIGGGIEVGSATAMISNDPLDGLFADVAMGK